MPRQNTKSLLEARRLHLYVFLSAVWNTTITVMHFTGTLMIFNRSEALILNLTVC